MTAWKVYFSLHARSRRIIRWRDLCAKAAVEQDPAKLLELVKQINEMLAEKQDRLEKPKTDAAHG